MKTLFLLRHAKSVPASGALRDFDRSLTEQGRRQAQRVGNYLREQSIELNLVLSSSALRARETTELVQTAAELVVEVRYDQRIYEASRQQLLEVISEINEGQSRVLLVGHNPGLEELLQHLTGHFASMSTATLAKIDLGVSKWAEVAHKKGNLDVIVEARPERQQK